MADPNAKMELRGRIAAASQIARLRHVAIQAKSLTYKLVQPRERWRAPMRRGASIATVSLVLLSGAAFAEKACAQSLEAQAKALDLITTTADRICNIVRLAGNSQSLKVTGDVKAQLSGLIKQLADIGISGAADFTTDQYEGVLRADLAASVERNAECKFKIFDKLQEKMIK
jgi:hypothetical protein